MDTRCVIQALQHLVRHPGYAGIVVLMLSLAFGGALGLGLVAEALLYRPLAVASPHELAMVSARTPEGDAVLVRRDTYDALERLTLPVTAIAGSLPGMIETARVGNELLRVSVDGVVGDYFGVLKVTPTIGRVLSRGDSGNREGSFEPVCVISYSLWQQHFGGKPDTLGRALILGETALTIVGVLPAEFFGVEPGSRVDVVVPMNAMARVGGMPPRAGPIRTVWARMVPGAEIDQLGAALRAHWPALLKHTAPSTMVGTARARFMNQRIDVASASRGLSPWRDAYGRSVSFLLFGMLWLTGLSCITLASVSLGRDLARRHEASVRRALGATRSQLLLPAVVDGLVLSGIAICISFPIGSGIAAALKTLFSNGHAPLDPTLSLGRLTAMLLLGAFVLSVACVGLAPAWIATHRLPLPGRYNVDNVSPRNSMDILVALQIGVALALLAPGSVFVTSFLRVNGRASGLVASNVFVATLANSPGGYSDLRDSTYYPALLETLRAIPGVQSVALATPSPGSVFREFPQPVDRLGGTARGLSARAAIAYVAGDYFGTTGIPIAMGSGLASAPPVAAGLVPVVLTRRAAAELFPERAPLGGVLRITNAGQPLDLTVVGVAADASVLDIRSVRPAVIFVPALQMPDARARYADLLIRAHLSHDDVERQVRSVVRSFEREFVVRFRPLDEQISRSLIRERFAAIVAYGYGVLALTLVSVGLCGTLSIIVCHRTKEFGIRRALGASTTRLVWSMTRRSVAAIAAGLAIGTPVAVIGVRAAQSFVGTADPIPAIWLGSGTLLILTCLAAAALPARKAVTADPMVSLRES